MAEDFGDSSMNADAIGGTRSRKLLVIEREATPYKIDLWNACAAHPGLSLLVIFTVRRDWSTSAGHQYDSFPDALFPNRQVDGRGLWGVLRQLSALLKAMRVFRPDALYITGYSHAPGLCGILLALLARVPYWLVADRFRVGSSRARSVVGVCRHCARAVLRYVVFQTTKGVLVCGEPGVTAAITAGCERIKVVNFPYVVCVERLRSESPETVPLELIEDRQRLEVIVLYSGRMIPRKGLPVLLEALDAIREDGSWQLWCEGDGPFRVQYESMATARGLSPKCRFVGFAQMALHSWLLRSSDVVVVPSVEDPWGIVVDEAMQLGKVVVSTDGTGSALDRITHGANGYRVPPGDSVAIGHLLKTLIADSALRQTVGLAASLEASRFTPARNAEVLNALLRA